jgi:AraC family transcriptional activator of adiA
MRICSDQPCIVLLTEKDVWIRVNGKEPISLKANHMALLNCENNIIDVSSLNNTLVAHISHDIIKDYLRFLNKDLSQIPVWQRSATPILTLPCLTPDVFRVAAQHSMMPAETESEKERTRALLFTVLSRFLDSKKFVSLMMYMLRNCVSDSVYQIIESDIHKDWNLSMVASCLCLSPSLLKKKLREEETSYSQLLTECRMQRALQLIVIHGFSIKRVAVSCGYHSVSYFIYVFRNYYGMTPTEYQERSAQRLSNRDSAASIVAQGNFYGTDRSAEGIRL